MSIKQRKVFYAVWMLVPAIIFLLALIAYPLIQVLTDSFTYKHLINQNLSGFAGLENFKKVISDEHFFQALRNTVVWTGFSVLGEFVFGVITAALLNQKLKGRTVFRTLIIIPWLVPVIVAGMTWQWMLDPSYGIINLLLVEMGLLDRSYDFFASGGSAMATAIMINVWRSFPYYTISLLAAMQSVSTSALEAAEIDGAGLFRRFFKIIMPQIKSTSLVLIFMHIIWTSINFDFIWILTMGGPFYSTETLPLMVYRYSMQDYNIGAASALSTILIMFMTVMFVFYYRIRNNISKELY